MVLIPTNKLVDLLYNLLGDVVVGEYGVHFYKLGNALPIIAELFDIFLNKECENYHLVQIQFEVSKVILHWYPQLIIGYLIDYSIQNFLRRVNKYFSSIDPLNITEFFAWIVLRKQISCFLCELFENITLIVFPYKLLVLNIVKLIVVFFGLFDFESGDIVDGGRKRLICGNVLLKVFFILLFTADIHHKDVIIYFTFFPTVFLISLFKQL